jgi:hypothetical protein
MGRIRNQGSRQEILLASHFVVGRHATSSLQLKDGRVSEHHARFYWADNRWHLRDLGSSNGTFVDGRKLGAGESVPVSVGELLAFGHEDDPWSLVDDSPPVAFAREAQSGRLALHEDGLLLLPGPDEPHVSIFRNRRGGWVAESESELRPLRDRSTLVIGQQTWTFFMPESAVPTRKTQPGISAVRIPLSVDNVLLRFRVSRDEEHIELELQRADVIFPLPARQYNHLLLTLARCRQDDAEESSEAERGWIYRDELCKMLGSEPTKLNVDIFRARRLFARNDVRDAAHIIERRATTSQLRLGTGRVEILAL